MPSDFFVNEFVKFCNTKFILFKKLLYVKRELYKAHKVNFYRLTIGVYGDKITLVNLVKY